MQQAQPGGKRKAIKKKSKKTNRRRIYKREKEAHIIGREGSDVICTPLFIALTSTRHWLGERKEESVPVTFGLHTALCTAHLFAGGDLRHYCKCTAVILLSADNERDLMERILLMLRAHNSSLHYIDGHSFAMFLLSRTKSFMQMAPH